MTPDQWAHTTPFANRANQLICMHTTYRSSGGDPRRFGRRSSAQCRWLGQAKVRGRPPAAPGQQASPVADWADRPDHSLRRSLADVAAGETLVFAGNRCRCPLSQLAERYGSEHGPVTDMALLIPVPAVLSTISLDDLPGHIYLDEPIADDEQPGQYL